MKKIFIIVLFLIAMGLIGVLVAEIAYRNSMDIELIIRDLGLAWERAFP